MFEYLKEFPVVLVTGPQRSGTRICAKMIAHDTGHRFVDEREIHTDSLYELAGHQVPAHGACGGTVPGAVLHGAPF